MNEDVKALLRGCQSVNQIESVAHEFQYNDGDLKVECSLCKADFTVDKFYKSAVAVDCNLLAQVTEEQFYSQYREYVRRLEGLGASTENRKLTDMGILQLVTHPDRKDLYQDIEAIVSVMVRAALLISVESVVESWISTMEHHASQRRTLGEMKLHEEMCIAVNGAQQSAWCTVSLLLR